MTPFIISSFAIIVFAALIHASFQLSVSVLTLLSGHAIGKQISYKKTLRLMNGFICGALLTTALLLSSLVYYLTSFIDRSSTAEQLVATICCGIMASLGLSVWVFYYRKGNGTALWLPRGFANFLAKRAKATTTVVEAFSLGMTSIIAELVFIVGPLLASGLAILTLPDAQWRLIGIALYTLLSLVSLVVILFVIGSGNTIARLQNWREQHKAFLQFMSGGSLIILALFLFADRVVGLFSYGGLR